MWFYLALLSAFFNAFANIARKTHGSLAQPAELVWWGMVFSLPLIGGLILITGGVQFTSLNFFLPAVAAGVMGCFSSASQFRAYKLSDASIISPITNLAPIATLIASIIFLGTFPSLAGFIGVLFVVGGVYYTSVSGKHDIFHPLMQLYRNPGSRAMLITVFFWTAGIIFQVKALEWASPATILGVEIVTMFICMSAYLLLQPQRHRLKHGERVIKRWGWHIVAISVFSTLSILFSLEAMKSVDPGYVLSVKRLDVLLTVLLSGLFLHERHILKRFKGSAIALVGVVIIFLLG